MRGISTAALVQCLHQEGIDISSSTLRRWAHAGTIAPPYSRHREKGEGRGWITQWPERTLTDIRLLAEKKERERVGQLHRRGGSKLGQKKHRGGKLMSAVIAGEVGCDIFCAYKRGTVSGYEHDPDWEIKRELERSRRLIGKKSRVTFRRIPVYSYERKVKRIRVQHNKWIRISRYQRRPYEIRVLRRPRCAVCGSITGDFGTRMKFCSKECQIRYQYYARYGKEIPGFVPRLGIEGLDK